MSNILKISKHKLDLARVELTGPSLLIGRSPLCDQVLRAPGILPVHFLLEWIGEGEFNPNEGMWTLFDMGHLLSSLDLKFQSDSSYGDLSAEGIIIDDDQQYLGLNWSIVKDRIQATNFRKGIISTQLKASTQEETSSEVKKLAIEIACLSKKEQSIQEIWHFFDQNTKPDLSKRPIPFEIHWSKEKEANFIFNSAPSAIFNLKGQKININQNLNILPQETYIIHFAEEIYFTRFVNRVEFNAINLGFFQDKFWIATFVSLVFFCFILFGINKIPFSTNNNTSNEELRIVKIVEMEVLNPVPVLEKISPPVPIPTSEPVMAEVKKQEVAPLKENPVSSKQLISTSLKKESGDSAAVQASTKTESGKITTGLNAPAKISDVNAVGLLGIMKKQAGIGRSKHISAETISQTTVDNTASGTDQKGVIVHVAKMGVIGINKSNTGGGGENNNSNLMEAQTTLRGAKDFSANSSGPLARSGGIKNAYSIGSGLASSATTSTGTGLGKKGVGGGSSSASDLGDVAGGLSKSQVYNVIKAYRRAIRTCFESALMLRNDLNGTLRLRFVINLSGAVNEVKIVNTDMKSNILESCVIQVIKQMEFPESPNQLATTVIYPFVFRRSF